MKVDTASFIFLWKSLSLENLLKLCRFYLSLENFLFHFATCLSALRPLEFNVSPFVEMVDQWHWGLRNSIWRSSIKDFRPKFNVTKSDAFSKAHDIIHIHT